MKKNIKSRILGKIRSLNYNNTHTIKELKPKDATAAEDVYIKTKRE